MPCELFAFCIALAAGEPPTPMVEIAGEGVAPFHLEVTAVTNRQFQAFVERRPEWRRDRIDPLFAEDEYLAHWASPVDLGEADPEAPVTRVSWFAARAYCAAIGRRLPRTDEWELAAAASETARDGSGDPAWRERILSWYARPATDEPPPVGSTPPNAWGVRDLHGVVWEWVLDVGSEIASDRGATGAMCGAGALGAADPGDYANFMRKAFRSSLEATYAGKALGFRCATEAP